MTTTTTTDATYRLSYRAATGWESPALEDGADEFPTEEAAWAAAEELAAADPGTWRGAEWRVEANRW